MFLSAVVIISQMKSVIVVEIFLIVMVFVEWKLLLTNLAYVKEMEHY